MGGGGRKYIFCIYAKKDRKQAGKKEDEARRFFCVYFLDLAIYIYLYMFICVVGVYCFTHDEFLYATMQYLASITLFPRSSGLSRVVSGHESVCVSPP